MNGIAKVPHQGVLKDVLISIFPGENILLNAKTEVAVRDPLSGQLLELDIWFPYLSLAFEFQDMYHYNTTWYSQRSPQSIKMADDILYSKGEKKKNKKEQERKERKKKRRIERKGNNIKKNKKHRENKEIKFLTSIPRKVEAFQKSGINLIQVPYWWDTSKQSLQGSIVFVRPDFIFSDALPPVPLNPPSAFSSYYIPDIGEPMLASFAESSSQIIFSINSPWWIGEKYDGIRCIYNQFRNTLYTRRGFNIELPDSLTHVCDNTKTFVDCELWAGRGQYLDTQQTIFATGSNWPLLRLVGFDDASPATTNLPFEIRYSNLMNSVNSELPFITVAARIECNNKLSLRALSQNVFGDGGEGLIIRKPKSTYESGRSDSLYKLKVNSKDAEALVLDTFPSGQFLLKLPNGLTFETHSDLPNIKIGDVVTFEFENISTLGMPIKPKVVRIRTDLSWRHILHDYSQHFSVRMLLPSEKQSIEESAAGVLSKKGLAEKLRNIFESFAKQRGLDPLKADSWYSIPGIVFKTFKGASIVMRHFKGGYIRALKTLFPEVQFEVSKFATVSRHYWSDVRNRKQIFDDFAKKFKFDPLIASNWGKIPVSQLTQFFPNARNFGQFHLVLRTVYPNIGVENIKMNLVPDGYWNQKTRKLFFDDFAKDYQFDPLHAANWYNMDKSLLKSRRGFGTIIHYHKHNLFRALLEAYPDIGLKKEKMYAKDQVKHMVNAESRKQYFESYAKFHKLDPLNPDTWYNISRRDVFLFGGKSVLSNVRDLPLELVTQFPNSNLQLDKFSRAK